MDLSFSEFTEYVHRLRDSPLHPVAAPLAALHDAVSDLAVADRTAEAARQAAEQAAEVPAGQGTFGPGDRDAEITALKARLAELAAAGPEDPPA